MTGRLWRGVSAKGGRGTGEDGDGGKGGARRETARLGEEREMTSGREGDPPR